MYKGNRKMKLEIYVVFPPLTRRQLETGRHVRLCQSRNGNQCSCCCCCCCFCCCRFVRLNSSKCNCGNCNCNSDSDSNCRAVCQRLSSISSRSDVIDTIWIYIWSRMRLLRRRQMPARWLSSRAQNPARLVLGCRGALIIHPFHNHPRRLPRITSTQSRSRMRWVWQRLWLWHCFWCQMPHTFACHTPQTVCWLPRLIRLRNLYIN